MTYLTSLPTSRRQRSADRAERRMMKKLRRRYDQAESENGYLMSMGGGKYPFPSFEEWATQGPTDYELGFVNYPV